MMKESWKPIHQSQEKFGRDSEISRNQSIKTKCSDILRRNRIWNIVYLVLQYKHSAAQAALFYTEFMIPLTAANVRPVLDRFGVCYLRYCYLYWSSVSMLRIYNNVYIFQSNLWRTLCVIASIFYSFLHLNNLSLYFKS